jgi:sarcosine oxidase
MNEVSRFDVIVIGVGSMGSAACAFLSERGFRVLGLEQFDIVHEKGSHTGQSRIIRKAYFEHPDYVPLLERSYENWSKLESNTNEKVYHKTGILYFGAPGSETISGIKSAAFLYDIPLERLSVEECRERHPAFRSPANFEIFFEAEAGFITPENSIRLYSELATARGAVIKTNEAVTEWTQHAGGVHVKTEKGEYSADKLVVTAGSWTSKILPGFRSTLTVRKQILAWVKPPNEMQFSAEKFPCWFVEDPTFGIFYGFPLSQDYELEGPRGLKIALHSPGTVTDPDAERIKPDSSPQEIFHALRNYIPGAGTTILDIKQCLYTYSPDANFIIDLLPGTDKRVVFACGFSGHGFKFVPVVGEILADLAIEGRTKLPIEFLRLNRFEKF